MSLIWTRTFTQGVYKLAHLDRPRIWQLVNLHRSTRTNEYAGMQMFLTTNLKRDWSAYFNTDLLSRTKTRANEIIICIIVTRYITYDS